MGAVVRKPLSQSSSESASSTILAPQLYRRPTARKGEGSQLGEDANALHCRSYFGRMGQKVKCDMPGGAGAGEKGPHATPALQHRVSGWQKRLVTAQRAGAGYPVTVAGGLGCNL